MKNIIWTKTDGTIAVTHILDTSKTSQEHAVNLLTNGDITGVDPTKTAFDKSTPADRYFREAWEFNGADVVEAMPKAKTIQMNKIRDVRNKELDRLDKEQLKGLNVLAKKQALREIPQTFDLTGAKNTTELKALIPLELKGLM